MTDDELDALCGGRPQHTAQCPRAGCEWVSRRYYTPGNARASLRNHDRVAHLLDKLTEASTDERPSRGVRARLYERF